MSYDPQSPSDRADMEPDAPSLCEWCDEQIDAFEVDVEAYERFGGLICRSCADVWAENKTTPTTCIETIDGDPATAIRLSHQIKVF